MECDHKSLPRKELLREFTVVLAERRERERERERERGREGERERKREKKTILFYSILLCFVRCGG